MMVSSCQRRLWLPRER
uniref:Uncharacterized protein n=1 Tax=Homo sapiens TaxID=9606 RepID=A0AAQ5BH44_HUMAN